MVVVLAGGWGVGLCIWKMGGLENRGVEGVPEAGKERAVDGRSKRVESGGNGRKLQDNA